MSAALRPLSGFICLVTFFIFLGTSQAAVVCTQADAVRRIKELGDQNALDEMTGNYSAAVSAQRAAEIRELGTRYCSVTDSAPQFDHDEQLDPFCTLLSGVLSGKRVYAIHCRSCGEVPGETCE